MDTGNSHSGKKESGLVWKPRRSLFSVEGSAGHLFKRDWIYRADPCTVDFTHPLILGLEVALVDEPSIDGESIGATGRGYEKSIRISGRLLGDTPLAHRSFDQCGRRHFGRSYPLEG